jgi:dCMP deaminase
MINKFVRTDYIKLLNGTLGIPEIQLNNMLEEIFEDFHELYSIDDYLMNDDVDNSHRSQVGVDLYALYRAKKISENSRDPSCKVGAVIVSPMNNIISKGFNRPPKGFDTEMTWEKNIGSLDCKYLYVVHAEADAILNSKHVVSGSTLYTTLSPCNECAKMIVETGIKEVVYLNKLNDEISSRASERMFEYGNVKYRQFSVMNGYV